MKRKASPWVKMMRWAVTGDHVEQSLDEFFGTHYEKPKPVSIGRSFRAQRKISLDPDTI